MVCIMDINLAAFCLVIGIGCGVGALVTAINQLDETYKHFGMPRFLFFVSVLSLALAAGLSK